MAAETEAAASGTSNLQLGMKDFLSGAVGGISQTLIGHPFDTIKTRLQTVHISQTGEFLDKTPKFTGVISCVRTTVKEEGFLALYKGMSSPLFGISFLNATLFLCYGQAKTWLQPDPDIPITLTQNMIAGTYAGTIQCAIVCPTELIKTRLQTQYSNDGAGRKYKGVIDCARQIIRENGILGLNQGMAATLLREVPAYALLFYSYEKLRRMMANEGESPEDIAPWKTIMAGGISGMACWAISYPQDTIKSRLQLEPANSRKYKRVLMDGGFFDCWRQTVQQEGHMSLWRGFSACFIRAFPANAVSFLGYEYTSKLWKKWHNEEF